MIENKPLQASDYNKLFEESKTSLGEHLAEQRSFVNLFHGNHFAKKHKTLTRAIEKAPLSEETKIRITKNHINSAVRVIINHIHSLAPTGVVSPKNPLELQDQKAAQIHKNILEDWKIQNKVEGQIRKWVYDYIVPGECFLHIYWDPNIGRKILPSPTYNIDGTVSINPPFFEGDAVTERIFPWDARIDPEAKSFEEARWVGFEKMADPESVRALNPENPDIDEAIKTDQDETYKIFDTNSGTYKSCKGKVLLRTIYYRPTMERPNGWFSIFTKNVTVIEGELPIDATGNVFFPIKYVGFDDIPTSARSTSLIRQVRSEQMEINRCASSIAHTQLTLGFDKLVVATGGEVESGGTKSGVRILRVPGGKQNADYIHGRSGEQFLSTLQYNVSELYNKLGVPEKWEEKAADADMMAMLYKNMKQKAVFSLPAKKFADFLIEVFEDILRLKKAYLSDEAYFKIVGRDEYVNIDEFRSLDDVRYQIKVEEGTEDLDTRFGRYITMTQVMQYMGGNMDDNMKGLIIRALPFANTDEITSELTMQYDNAKNILLALDRGEQPEVSEIADPLYMAKMLNARIFKPDFKFLNPQIQQTYYMQRDQYNQIYAQKAAQVEAAKQGFIPADGPTVPVDGMYENHDPNNPSKTKRVQFPLVALNWLKDKLEAQGAVIDPLMGLGLEQQAQIAQQLQEMQGPPPMQDLNTMTMQGL